MQNSSDQSRSDVQSSDSLTANLNRTLLSLQDTYEKADIAIHEVQINGDPNPFEGFIPEGGATPVEQVAQEIAAKSQFLQKYMIV